MAFLRLNLGSGDKRIPGYVSVDRWGKPDVLWDLEKTPWPWEDNSVERILLSHVLEHLGQQTDVFFAILKELYRVCIHDARIDIIVPHPRHNDFLSDPTHVRPILPESLGLLSRKLNDEWERLGNVANSPLGKILGVDFEIASVRYLFEEPWESDLRTRRVSIEEVEIAAQRYNNVIKQIEITLRVVKQ